VHPLETSRKNDDVSEIGAAGVEVSSKNKRQKRKQKRGDRPRSCGQRFHQDDRQDGRVGGQAYIHARRLSRLYDSVYFFQGRWG
jgi:hypothetical protein